MRFIFWDEIIRDVFLKGCCRHADDVCNQLSGRCSLFVYLSVHRILIVIGGLCPHPVKHRGMWVIFGLAEDCITSVVSEGWSLIDSSWMATIALCPICYSVPAVAHMSAGDMCWNRSGSAYSISIHWSSIQGT